jgi:sugar phosphate permease
MRAPATPAAAPPKLHYAWIVTGLTFLTLLVAAGIRATPGVLMVPLEQDLGWSRATISLAVSINLMLFGLMAPFSAALVDRLGLRLVMSLSLALLAVGVASTSLITQTWQLILLWGVVVGGGTGMIALALGASVASRWFEQKRGLVMGILSASTATGQLLFLPFLAWIVERWGWRNAVLGIALAALLAVPLLALLMRNRPADIGLLPYGADPAHPPAPPVHPTANPFASALAALADGMRSRDFWLLAGTFFVCGASTNGLVGTHLIPACLDHGIPEIHAAGLLAAMGIFDLIGVTLSGWLSDRWDSRWLLAWYYGLRGLSLLALPFAFDLSFYGLSVFALFYGLDWVATVPPTVKLTIRSFGAERAGIMFGWIFAAHQLGAAFIALAAGTIRTELGDYLAAFLFAGLLCLAATVASLMIGNRFPPLPQPIAEGETA